MNLSRSIVAPFGAIAFATLLAFASFGIVANIARAEDTPAEPVVPVQDEVNEDSAVDLSITKIADNHTPKVGSEVVYTIEVTNEGSNDAASFTVTDSLPTGMSFVSATPAESTLDPLTWEIDSLAIGQTATIYVTVLIEEGTEGTELVNTASVHVGGDVVDDNASNDSDSDTLSVLESDEEEDDHTDNNDTDEQCEIEGHKYNQAGTPLADWSIALVKVRTYENGESQVFPLVQTTTDAKGYYCIEWDGVTGLPENTDESYDFVYRIYEMLKAGWSYFSIEKGATDEDLEIVSEENVIIEADRVGTQVFDENGILPGNTAYHVD